MPDDFLSNARQFNSSRGECFHSLGYLFSLQGEDLREGNSPSWFNAVEAVQVIRYVQDLRKFDKHPVKLADIGIITPYRKQVTLFIYTHR